MPHLGAASTQSEDSGLGGQIPPRRLRCSPSEEDEHSQMRLPPPPTSTSPGPGRLVAGEQVAEPTFMVGEVQNLSKFCPIFVALCLLALLVLGA